MNKKNSLAKMLVIPLFTAIIAVCSWITIPLTVPLTLQTFAVFLTLIVLGGRNGTLSILIYILLGAVGVPVFSGFTAGVGHLLGATGGYITSFLVSGLIFWLTEKIFRGKKLAVIISLLIGLITVYLLGTLWYCNVYVDNKGFVASLSLCVFPFIIPDIIKITLAYIIGNRVKKIVNRI